jgi:hypothetical protein
MGNTTSVIAYANPPDAATPQRTLIHDEAELQVLLLYRWPNSRYLVQCQAKRQ